MRPLLAVLVDGLRHDYVNPTDSPFLWALQQEGASGCVRECFAGQLRPAFLAGLYPNRSGIGHLFCHDPEGSPFADARFLPAWVSALPRIGPRLRDWLVTRARAIEAARGHTASALYAYAAEVPWRYLPMFAFSEHHDPTEPGVYPSPSLFDLLREAGRRWLYIGYPHDDQSTKGIVSAVRSRRIGDEHLVFLHFAEVDWSGHLGPDHPARRRALQDVDSALSGIVEDMARSGMSPDILVFGDHGMAEVRKVVNILPALQQLDSKPGRDYAFFLDSTVARFWFREPEAVSAVRARLKELRHGVLLDDGRLRRLGLDGAPPALGELFYVVPAGTVIFPSFFQKTSPPGGMHGYLPDERENWGRWILRAADLSADQSAPVDLVDVFPIMATLLDLPVPDGCQGRSFAVHRYGD